MVLLTTSRQFELLRTDDFTQLILASLFAGLTGLGAFIAIPLSFSPIPITFQTLFVLLSGFVLGRHYGPLSQIIYVVLGIIGVPWFSGGKFGLTILLGVSGGYLLGFILASFVIGWITDISKESRNPFALFTSAVLGSIIIYIFGVLGLFRYYNLWTSLEFGVFPFIPGDLFKIILVFIFLILFMPDDEMSFETGFTKKRINIWLGLMFSTCLGTFIIFFVYLYSNGPNIPSHLPEISFFTGICIIPCLYFAGKRLNSFNKNNLTYNSNKFT